MLYEDFTTSIFNRVVVFLQVWSKDQWSELLGCLLEMKIPWSHPKPTNLESLVVELYAKKAMWPLVYNEALKLKFFLWIGKYVYVRSQTIQKDWSSEISFWN